MEEQSPFKRHRRAGAWWSASHPRQVPVSSEPGLPQLQSYQHPPLCHMMGKKAAHSSGGRNRLQEVRDGSQSPAGRGSAPILTARFLASSSCSWCTWGASAQLSQVPGAAAWRGAVATVSGELRTGQWIGEGAERSRVPTRLQPWDGHRVRGQARKREGGPMFLSGPH